MYGTLYRHVFLPMFDRVLKGRRTVDYWRAFEESQWWPAERHAANQFESLAALIAHAWDSCPGYREWWSECGLSPTSLQTPADFARWPLLTRERIRADRARLRTTRPIPMVAKGTGGSSGVPLQFDVSHDSHERRTALMWRGYGWAGAQPGTRQLYIWGGALKTVPGWKRLKQNLHNTFDRKTLVDCFAFTPDRMAEHVRTWNRCRPEAVVAYVNPLYEFARHCEEQGLKLTPPGAIVVGAEKLHPHQRELIERVCGAPVFETYGSREFMMIGAECERHRGLHLSQENLFVEVLDDDGQPVADGDEGNVVVTDLFNFGMPFVRYVNGDRAIAGWSTCECGRGLPLLKGVAGRRLDTLITPDGRKVPGEFFPHLLKDFAAIRRFQVVQRDPAEIVVRVVAPGLSEPDRAVLLDAIGAVTGAVVRLRLEQVDEIPLTSQGKHRIVVNELSPPPEAEPWPVAADARRLSQVT
jgi:phenylacetate-CoA ligase